MMHVVLPGSVLVTVVQAVPWCSVQDPRSDPADLCPGERGGPVILPLGVDDKSN